MKSKIKLNIYAVCFCFWFGFRSLRVPISSSTRRCLPFDAKYRIEDLWLEFKCHQKDTAKVCHEIQFDYRWFLSNKIFQRRNNIWWFFFWIFGISDLNLSNNQINKLPDELADLAQLLRLDISHNLFLSLPKVVFKMPKLRQLKANNNAIIGKHIWIVEFIPFKIIQPKLSSEINGNHFVTISLHK